ncbi:uncharacterized protein ACRADG_006751 [Cochliomyia hominivorax]
MTYYNRIFSSSSSSSSFSSFIFRKIIVFILFLVIYRNLVKLKLIVNVNVNASENIKSSLEITTPLVVTDDNTDLLLINNFDGNFFSNNQIIFDSLQHKVKSVNNDLLSCSMCDKSNKTENSSYKRIQIVARQPKELTNFRNSLTLKHTSKSETKNFMSSNSSLSSSSSSSLLLQHQHLRSRRKRYLSFPEGSSFSVAVCFTVGIIGNPRYNYMSFGLNWGVAYDLPNNTWILNHLHGFSKRPIPVAVWHRRSRRSLYKEIENVVDNMGYNGRACILRALCESKQYFQSFKMGMIGEMLRVIFSLPKQRIFKGEINEFSEIKLYDQAYRRGYTIDYCSEQYDCNFSLLELAFGKYSTPPQEYYTNH